jgi:hypothetical protein
MAQGVKTREKTVEIDKPKKVKGLYLNNGTWWLSRQRKGKRVFVSLETKVFSEAVVRAEQMAETPELNPGGLLEAEIERYLNAKVSISSAIHRKLAKKARKSDALGHSKHLLYYP